MAVWYAVILTTVSIVSTILSIYIVRRDYAKRIKLKGQGSLTGDRSLHVFSIANLILSVIYNIIQDTLYFQRCSNPGLNYLNLYIWWNIKNTTILYQIARLKNCFSSKQVQSANLGYPNWLFNVLYIYGVMLMIIALVRFILNVSTTPTISQYVLNVCAVNNDDLSPDAQLAFVTIGFVAYVSLDWGVLILYIIKICQIYRRNAQNLKESTIDKIKYVLNKIIFLTILLEINSGIVYWFYVVVTSNDQLDTVGYVAFIIQ